MKSRDKILNAVKASQPVFIDAPDISDLGTRQSPPSEGWTRQQDNAQNTSSVAAGVGSLTEKFITALQTIGGHSKTVNNFEKIKEAVAYQFPNAKRIVSTFNELGDIAEVYGDKDTIESAHDIDVAILNAHFGVAENGAVWLTEDMMCDRVLPFICQELVVIIKAHDIVANMHEAYKLIGDRDYGFSIFIAGPSKTADIEQSLVLGAHGPISMTVFILE